MPSAANAPVRKSARKLRWFKETLHRQVDALTKQTGIDYSVDYNEIRALFLRWLDAFEAQKPAELDDRSDFVDFASGLMLRELIRSKSVNVTSLPPNPDKENPAYFWPEGYLYVVLCLNIRAAVFKQDFNIEKHISPNMEDLRTWWSFKEKVEVEDPNLAIGFFNLFAGSQPNWNMPSIFSARKTSRTNDRFSKKYAQKTTLEES